AKNDQAMNARRAALLALAVLATLLVVTWAPVLLGSETFWLGDFTWTTTPLLAFCAAELRAGRLPERNPSLLGGLPHVANPLAAEPELVTVGALLVTACVIAAPELAGRRVRTLGLTAAATVGLAEVQLFPAVAFSPNSVRATGVALAEAERWSAHPLRLVGLI